MNRRLIAALCLLYPLSTSAVAGDERTDVRRWVSTNQSLDDLGKEISNLYLTLWRANILPTMRYLDTEGRQVVKIMRDLKLHSGNSFPSELDEMLCRMNKHVCTLQSPIATPGLASQGTPGTATPGASSEVRSRWTNGANDTLNLPLLDFRESIRFGEYDKTKDDSLFNLVINKTGGCLSFDIECRSFIAGFNQSKIKKVFGPDFQGSVVLPVKVLFVDIDLKGNAEAEKALRNNLVPIGPAHLNSSHGASPWTTSQLIARHESILSAISYPGKVSCEQRCENIKKTGQECQCSDPVVAVMDGWVDRRHCRFMKKLDDHSLIIRNLNASDDVYDKHERNRKGCTTPEEKTEIDHGTQVTGIVAATIPMKDGKPVDVGLEGMMPEAIVKTYEVRIVNIETGRAENERRSLLDALKEHPKANVVNLSFDYFYDSGNGRAPDVFGDIIKYYRSVLFVASAGNIRKNLDSACDRRPACMDLPHVISVAAVMATKSERCAMSHALWETPDKKSGSNFGKKVDIGAPGAEVPGIFSFNRAGMNSGTSFAAPLVTGAAAMILQRADGSTFLPVQIKNRLIYTSDLDRCLEDKLLGGRLNVARAVDFTFDKVILEKGTDVVIGGIRKIIDEDQEIRGFIRRVGSSDEIKFNFYRDGRTSSIKKGKLRRIERRISKNEVTAFWVENRRANYDLYLTKGIAYLEEPKSEVHMDVATTDKDSVIRYEFPLGGVIRFVSAMREQTISSD